MPVLSSWYFSIHNSTKHFSQYQNSSLLRFNILPWTLQINVYLIHTFLILQSLIGCHFVSFKTQFLLPEIV